MQDLINRVVENVGIDSATEHAGDAAAAGLGLGLDTGTSKSLVTEVVNFAKESAPAASARARSSTDRAFDMPGGLPPQTA